MMRKTLKYLHLRPLADTGQCNGIGWVPARIVNMLATGRKEDIFHRIAPTA